MIIDDDVECAFGAVRYHGYRQAEIKAATCYFSVSSTAAASSTFAEGVCRRQSG